MKNRVMAFSLVLVIGVGGWLATTLAQRSAPFDIQQTNKELEILEGILSTTLKYAVDDSSRTRTRLRGVLQFGRSQQIESFYLYGQGAIFLIPNSRSAHSSRPADLAQVRELIDQVEEKGTTTDTYLRSLERRIKRADRGFILGGIEPVYIPVPPQPPEPPIAPRAPGTGSEELVYAELAQAYALSAGLRGKEVSGEDLDEWIQTNRGALQEALQESEQSQAEMEQREQKIQGAIISALAQHGDSLSAIKPEEYISLIFLSDSRGLDSFVSARQNRSGARVVSVQMSQLSEFKRGALTLDQLRERLVQYEL